MKALTFLCGILLLLFFPDAAGQTELSVSRSVCLLRGEGSGGSGFFAEVDDEDVVITCNHVIFGAKNIRIRDINGREYSYDTVYSSPDRDLAVIPVRRSNFRTMPNLRIHHSPDMLPVNTRVTVYGDSLGDGVITASGGKFLGAGPESIEVDAGFVEGNSGGPVIENTGGRVIGVAFCGIVRSEIRPERIGSRFRATRFTPSIRRFAVRIDRISLSGMEKISLARMEKDRLVWEKYDRLHREAAAALPGKARTLLEDASFRTMEFPDRWNVSWLKKETEKKRSELYRLWNRLFQEKIPVPVSADEHTGQLTELWKECLPETQFRKGAPLYASCLVCKGKKMLPEPACSGEDDRSKQRHGLVRCFHCAGQGRRQIADGPEYALTGEKFRKELPELIEAEPRRFADLVIGGSCPRPLNGQKPLETVHFQIFRVVRYAGHPRLPEVTETRLWFAGDLLLRADLLVPAPDPAYAAKTAENIGRQYPDLRQALFSVVPAARFSDQERMRKASRILSEYDAGKWKPPVFLNDRSLAEDSRRGGIYDQVQRLEELKSLVAEDPFRRYFFRSGRFRPAIRYPAFCRITIQHRDFGTLASFMAIRQTGNGGFSF